MKENNIEKNIENTLEKLMLTEKKDNLGRTYYELTKEGKKLLIEFALEFPFYRIKKLINLFRKDKKK